MCIRDRLYSINSLILLWCGLITGLFCWAVSGRWFHLHNAPQLFLTTSWFLHFHMYGFLGPRPPRITHGCVVPSTHPRSLRHHLNVMFGALGSISDQNFYMRMQNVPSMENVRARFLIHTLELKLWHFEICGNHAFAMFPAHFTWVCVIQKTRPFGLQSMALAILCGFYLLSVNYTLSRKKDFSNVCLQP